MARKSSGKGSEFDRMRGPYRPRIERGQSDFERARGQFEERMGRLRAEMEAALAEFERALERGIDSLGAARDYRDRFGGWPQRKWRPRRRPPGGEPAAVKPRPNPTPLVDGAEAPID